MTERKNGAPEGADTDYRKYGHLLIMAGAAAIIILGMFGMLSINAPYHPEVLDDTAGQDNEAASRSDGTLLD